MENASVVANSNYTSWTSPAAWTSQPLDMRALGGDSWTLHIHWQDCALTFFLWAASSPFLPATSPPWHDFTAEYRVIDPGWIDPVLGDPRQEWPVRAINLGFRYVRIGWTAGAYGLAAYLLITMERGREVL